MNTKTFSILAIVTALVVIAAVMLTPQKPTTPEPEKFFPNLMSALSEVTEINVRTKDNSITMIRGDGQWLLKEKHNYPVAVDKVNKLLLGAADLTVVEAKTSNPALYSKIGVEDQSTLLTLKKGESETVASLIIGNNRVAKVDSTRRKIYVRKPDDKQTWLTLGQLPLEKNPKDWLERQIIDIDSNNIRRVSITHADGDKVVVFKDSPKDENYQLADLPENAKVKAAQLLNDIASTLTRLNLDDVTTDIEFDDKASTRAVFTTFDGLEVTMTTTKKEGKHYAKFAAAFNSAAVFVEPPKTDDQAQTEKADDKPKVDAKKQADTLNAKFKGWVYELANVDNLEKKRDDLIEKPAEEEKAADEASAVEESKELPIPFTQSDEDTP
ncbi:MAG: DUF4340 domain-containing protein [Pseudomonadota bacterium]